MTQKAARRIRLSLLVCSLACIGIGGTLIYRPLGIVAVGILLWIDLFQEGLRHEHPGDDTRRGRGVPR